jgi:enoyl-CoA hydratase
MKIAFIGLGNMGGGMAANLAAAGHAVRALDLSPDALARAVGKAKAMEMVLTGRMMDAAEAERSGLVARVVPAAELLDEALKTAAAIAAMPPMAAMVNKEMVNAAFEMGLDQGLRHERRLFQILAATEDKAEGMKAFVEKREAKWKGR